MPSRTAQRREAAREAIRAGERRASIRRRTRNAVVATAVASALIVAVALAASSGGGHATAANGAPVAGVAYSSALLSGIPQHGPVLGSPRAPVHVIEFADLQCPYCDEFARQALPQIITHFVRTGEVNIEFRTLSFIGPDSVRAGHAAAAAEQQNRLWNFVDLVYLNQGEENSGYATDAYVRRLLAAVPGLDVAKALRASGSSQAQSALNEATSAANQVGINSTPSFLVGRSGERLRQFQPASLTPEAFIPELNSLLGGHA
jgi:protein-disulfide isomerase